jgi:hypothetical protein
MQASQLAEWTGRQLNFLSQVSGVGKLGRVNRWRVVNPAWFVQPSGILPNAHVRVPFAAGVGVVDLVCGSLVAVLRTVWAVIWPWAL